MKRALIACMAGQDEAYLAKFLFNKFYELHCINRKRSSFNIQKIDHFYQNPNEDKIKFKHYYGGLSDSMNIIRIIQVVKPDEVYNLGTLRDLKALRNPRSPYGVTILCTYLTSANYREVHRMYSYSRVLFNHNSLNRAKAFVTRNNTRTATQFKNGNLKALFLGNLYAKQDGEHAKEYIKAMWLMIQRDKPEVFVHATGETHGDRGFYEPAPKELNAKLELKRKSSNEGAVVKSMSRLELNFRLGQDVFKVDKNPHRQTEMDLIVNNTRKAHSKSKWKRKYNLSMNAKEMFASELMSTYA